MSLNLSYLTIFSFVYLSFSTIYFYLFWLKAPWSYFTSLLFLGLSCIQLFNIISKEGELSFSKGRIVQILSIALLITFLSGISGIGGMPSFDIRHHLQKVFDFSQIDSPIFYKEAFAYASYYYGFYIVPGLVFKHIGHINIVLFLWESLGLFLGLCWISHVFKGTILYILLLFLVSNLLSIVFPVINNESLLTSPFFYFQDTQWNLLPLYLSLRWIPNQFIYVFILIGIILTLKPHQLPNISTLLISGLFWSPFATLSIGIIYLCLTFKHLIRQRYFFIYLLVNAFLAGFLVLYLLSNKSSTSIEFALESVANLKDYIVLIIFDVIIFYFLINKEFQKMPALIVSLILLLLFPLIKLGVSNDLYSRAILPPILVLYIYYIKSFSYRDSKYFFRIILLLSISILPLKYIGYSTLQLTLKPEFVPISSKNTYVLLKQDYPEKNVADQYLMNKDSFFYKYLLAK